MNKFERVYSGTKSEEVSAREKEHAALSRRAAAEGMVLLKNDGALPLAPGSRIALFGGGAEQTVKGGTGSGDVNERNAVNIRQGLKDAGFTLTSEAWLDDYAALYTQSRLDWKAAIYKKLEASSQKDGVGFFFAYSSTPYEAPSGRAVTEQDLAPEADAAVYVISRIAGEGADRFEKPGDYELTEREYENLAAVVKRYPNTVVVMNTGGPIDLTFMDQLPVSALLFMSQAGMEGGRALADVLGGKVCPSGKLTDTWAMHYSDYPAADTFSHMNGQLDKEYYTEGIYVGYRYFDTFGVKPRYPFGFGLSYTTFDVRADAFAVAGERASAVITVRNTGKTAGKEVVQLYAACPQGKLKKEAKRLCAFAKTPLLAPGEVCRLQLSFPLEGLASFDESAGCWMMEAGTYALLCGTSSANATPFAALSLDGDWVCLKTQPICPLSEPLNQLEAPEVPAVDVSELPVVQVSAADLTSKTAVYYDPAVEDDEAGQIVRSLTTEELLKLVVGDAASGSESNLGSAGNTVPGAAGETTNCLEEKLGISPMVLADGPAGIRLPQSYQVRKDGSVVTPDPFSSMEKGFFSNTKLDPELDTYHHYCTAFPVGTLLAQTWDTQLVEEVGRAVGREMVEMGVALWLAPGMNIHRNPLCGRNFEYYAEDPVLAGVMAAAVTQGVQQNPGVGTTIKHFACNNSEDNRMGVDCVVSERALREIYLRGFEIAVRTSQPMSIMSSYNLVNGVHAANNGDLLTKAARSEWGFAGMVMTDWTTTAPHGGSTPEGCIKAGNDLIMPGLASDFTGLRAALENGTLTEEELRICAARVVRLMILTNRHAKTAPYGEMISGFPGMIVRTL